MTHRGVSSDHRRQADAALRPDEAATTDRDTSLLEAIERWEGLPHNREGSDKTWVEDLLQSARDHLNQAVGPGG